MRIELKLSVNNISELNTAPIIEQVKKTFEGEKRSEMERMANRSVPEMNPNCTAEVRSPSARSCKSSCDFRKGRMALPANHNEVPQNCATTMVNKTRLRFLNTMSL